jgi:hypothetical protein
MITRPSISRPVWLVFAGSVLLFGATWWTAHHAPPVAPNGAAEFAALERERERLKGNDNTLRDRLREQQRGLARIAWTPQKLAALQQQQGEGWRWNWAPGDPSSRVTLQRLAPKIEEWPAYQAIVAQLARQPGVIVESVEFLAEGTARDRRFTRVAIGLRFIVADASSRDGRRASPSHGPPTVAPAQGPATSRKVGAFTPHCRPSASAQPPSPGTDVASFRSRPSGVQGRRGSEHDNRPAKFITTCSP